MKILKMDEIFLKCMLSTGLTLLKHFRNTAPEKASIDSTR